MDRDLPGLDVDRVERWLAGRLDTTPPFVFELIAAGGSNLTFRVTDHGGQTWALRRPPVGHGLATAHDVQREWRILEALHDHGGPVRVPEPVARCADSDVTGAPFFVMAFVDGPILRTESDAAALDPAVATHAAESLVATQAALHDLDVDRIGLGDLGRRTGYIERQLWRWSTQVAEADGEQRPLIAELHTRLAADVPSDAPRPSLVHGDYRFDNVVLSEAGDVAAVLDWELCTLGDPVADACWSLLYWAESENETTFLPSSPTCAATLPDRAWAASRYEQLSARSLDAWPWFEAFGWWKMACIVDGVHTRRRAGARSGAPSASLEAIAERVDSMLAMAETAAGRAGI